MWARSIFEQILNICVMLSTHFIFGLWNPLVCRVVVLEDPECRQHQAHSVMVVDTRIVSVGALVDRVFSNRIEFVWFLTETMVLTG